MSEPGSPVESILAALRKPFPPEVVGKLPKLTCKECSKAPGRVCPTHKKQECPRCHNWISTAHIDLDYVGHAEVTDRLLSVDPTWSWEPCGMDEHGLPALSRNRDGQVVGLWIRLTVGGVTRLGYGSVEGGGFDAEKQLIGDALRNAAMRFGVALDLWSKSELESQLDEPDPPEDTAPPPDPEELARTAGWKSVAEYQECRSVLAGLVKDIDGPERLAAWEHWKLANGVDTAKPFDLATFDAMSEALGQIARGVDTETGEVATTAAVAPQEAAAPNTGDTAPEGQSDEPGAESADPGDPGPCAYCGSTLSQRFTHEGRVRCIRGSACARRVADAAAGISEEPEPVAEQASLT